MNTGRRERIIDERQAAAWDLCRGWTSQDRARLRADAMFAIALIRFRKGAEF